MPIYEYRCKECAAEFEQLRSMREADQNATCPSCGSEQGERKMSSFASGGGNGGGGCAPSGGGGRGFR